jgi:hypothetical protein
MHRVWLERFGGVQGVLYPELECVLLKDINLLNSKKGAIQKPVF